MEAKQKRLMAKILLLILVSSLIIFTLIAFWIYTVVREVPLGKLNRLGIGGNLHKTISAEKTLMEEGGIVSLDVLENYMLFSETKMLFKNWLEEKIDEGVLAYGRPKSGRLIINKDFYVDPLLVNHCPEIYCYQHRIEFENIPSVFWKGLIGVEDYRFLRHFGVDFKSIARAVFQDILEMRFAQGGSTLTQQLVKNIFLTSEKTLVRKIKEMILSVYIEYVLEKDEILEAYFNEAYWGSVQGTKVKGVFAASLFYFGKQPNYLEPYEVAILIALLKGPGFYSPLTQINRLRERTEAVYRRLISVNLFSNSEDRLWQEEDWESWKVTLLKKQQEMPYKAFAFVEQWAKGSLSTYEHYLIFRKASELLEEIRKTFSYDNIAIKIMIGKPYKNPEEDLPFMYYSKLERKKLVAIHSEKHQAGSTLKPLIYAKLLETGLKLSDMVSMAPITLKLKSGEWTPRESHQIAEEEVTIAEALMKSYNGPLVRLVNDVGFDVFEIELKKIIQDLKLPLKEYPAQLLGSIELSLGQMYNMYSDFIMNECQKLNNALGEYGEIDSPLFVLADPALTTIRKSVQEEIREMRFFGKTGTSNSGFDNWFVYFDGVSLGVIWVGHEGDRTGQNFHLYGSTTAFKIFQNFYYERGKRFNEFTCHYFRYR